MMDRLAALRELGVVWSHEWDYVGEGKDRHRIELESIESVKLPFSAEDWLRVAMRDGDDYEGSDYLGGCCGNLSYVQDQMNGIFRDGGWCSGPEFIDIAESLIAHDGEDSDFVEMDDKTFAQAIEGWKTGEQYVKDHPDEKTYIKPYFKMGVVYNGVKHLLKTNSLHVPSNGLNPPNKGRSEEQNIVSVLGGTLTRLTWADLFSREGDELIQHKAARELHRAKIFPLVRRLNELLTEEGVGFTGWAIVKSGTDEVMTNHRGLCLYHDDKRDAAERMLKLFEQWVKDDLSRKTERDEEFDEAAYRTENTGEIVRVLVSENGMEIIR